MDKNLQRRWERAQEYTGKQFTMHGRVHNDIGFMYCATVQGDNDLYHVHVEQHMGDGSTRAEFCTCPDYGKTVDHHGLPTCKHALAVQGSLWAYFILGRRMGKDETVGHFVAEAKAAKAKAERVACLSIYDDQVCILIAIHEAGHGLWAKRVVPGASVKYVLTEETCETHVDYIPEGAEPHFAVAGAAAEIAVFGRIVSGSEALACDMELYTLYAERGRRNWDGFRDLARRMAGAMVVDEIKQESRVVLKALA